MGILGVMEPRQGREQTWPTARGSDTDASTTPWWQAVGANWRISNDDDPAHNLGNMIDGYNTAADALVQLGYPADRYRPAGTTLLGNRFDVPEDKRAQVWADIAAARAKDPRLFQGYPTDQNKFEQWARARQGGRAADMDAASRGGFGSAAVPGLVHGLTDIAENPEHAALFAYGGGAQSVAGMVLRQGLGNAVASGLMAPEVAATRAKMGEGYSREDFDRDLLMGFAGGAALTGAHVAIGKGIPAIVNRFGGDKEVASALADTIEPINRTPDEQAALHVVNRAAEIDAASPYVDTYAGQALHRDRLQAATDQLVGATPRPRAPIGAVADTANAASVFMSRVGRAESGGNDLARPIDPKTGKPLSSALGRYQFTEGTWLSYYKARFGKSGLSDSEILAKRTDGHLQDVLLGDAVQNYSKILHGVGEPVTPGNLYVMHFAGEGGGRALFKAARDRPAAEVMGAKAVKANPFLEKMTVGDVLAWADRRMGGRGTAERIEGARPAEESAGATVADDGGVAAAEADLRDIDMQAARAGDDVDAAMASRVDDGAAAPHVAADLPQLREDQFASEEMRRAAQTHADADALGVLPTGDTRGGGVQYHGARGEVPKLSEGYYNPANIYGGFDTFYTTDAVDIAHGYGRRNQAARVYRVDERDPVNTFDMEQRMSPEDLAKIFGIDDWKHGDGFVEDAIHEATGSDGKINLREAMDEIRTLSSGEGYSRDTVQEFFDAAIYNLREAGYGAMSHLGGLKTGREPHHVKIYFEAHNQLDLTDLTPPRPEPLALEDAPARLAEVDQANAQVAPVSPDLPSPTAEKLSDPVGAGAREQLDGLTHDLRGQIEAGELEGLTFTTAEGAAPRSAAEILAELEADRVALDALKGCL